jgi:ABC-2 type transport system permease protein
MGFQNFQISGIPTSAFISNILISYWNLPPLGPIETYIVGNIATQAANYIAANMGFSYMNFLAPGMVGMILLFASMVAGLSILWDREFGFLKEVMVAPVSRLSIAVGRTLGGVTTAIMQGALILGISLFMGVKISGPMGLSLSLVFMVLISTAFVCLGMAFASRMTDFQGFMLIMNFIIFPLFFLSGALFPLSAFPSWVQTIAYFDPLTYGVDALRTTLIGMMGTLSLWVNFGILIGFTAGTLLLSTYLFQKSEVD